MQNKLTYLPPRKLSVIVCTKNLAIPALSNVRECQLHTVILVLQNTTALPSLKDMQMPVSNQNLSVRKERKQVGNLVLNILFVSL